MPPRVQHPIAWLPTSWTVALLTSFLLVIAFINQHVPGSYMDEPFHVPMTQQYCRGDFISWDPKITTFPGLYYLGTLYAWLSRFLFAWMSIPLELTCSGPYLRSLNAVLAVLCIQLAYALSMELQRQQKQGSSKAASSRHQNSSSRDRGHESAPTKQLQGHQGLNQQHRAAGVALVVGLLPTQLFFAFLFYTDVPSMLFLLLTELLLVRGATHAAAAAGAAAIGMRQTNAVWVTFLTGAAMLQHLLQQQREQQEVSRATGKPSSAAGQQGSGGEPSHNGAAGSIGSSKAKQQPEQQSPVAELVSLLGCAWQHKWGLLSRFWLLLLLPLAFCAFLIINGSITLGDKEAHAPSAHLMQPLYLGLFCLANAALLLLQPSITAPLAASCRARPRAWLLGVVVAGAAGCFLAARYSLEHPYLLADNRHYTFYIWRKVFKRHWAVRFCMVPLYVLSWVLLLTGLAATQHWLWVVAFAASCCVTLVPAWLIEFRYFTAPFTLAMLHLPAPPRLASLLTAAGFCCVNVLTLFVFALRPYAWVDGSQAHFMW